MYTALAIMLCGFIAGRAIPGSPAPALVRRLLSAAIFLLLFLLGIGIGSNTKLVANLPRIGIQSLILMLCCVAGSILCAWLLTSNAIWRKDNNKD